MNVPLLVQGLGVVVVRLSSSPVLTARRKKVEGVKNHRLPSVSFPVSVDRRRAIQVFFEFSVSGSHRGGGSMASFALDACLHHH